MRNGNGHLRRFYRHQLPLYMTSAIILQDLYPHEFRRSWAYKLAYSRGWITAEQYYEAPKTEPCRSVSDMMYSTSPMFGLLKKDMAIPTYMGVAMTESPTRSRGSIYSG